MQSPPRILFLCLEAESPSVFIGRQRDGRRLPRMLTKEFSSSSSPPSPSPPPLLSPPLSLLFLFFSFPSLVPLWNILVLPSCARVATANLTLWDYACWENERGRQKYSHVESSCGSLYPFVFLPFFVAPSASTINILVRDSCTATPSADHVTDICKVSIIHGTAPTNWRSSFFLRWTGIFVSNEAL